MSDDLIKEAAQLHEDKKKLFDKHVAVEEIEGLGSCRITNKRTRSVEFLSDMEELEQRKRRLFLKVSGAK